MNPELVKQDPPAGDTAIQRHPIGVVLRPVELTTPVQASFDLLPGTSTAKTRALSRVARDRAELVHAARGLRGPINTLHKAQHVLSWSAQALRWALLAGNVVALAAWLRSDLRRVPKALLLGLAVQAWRGWKHSGTRPALASPGPP